MKRLKFLTVFVFLLVGTLTLFSFTNEKYRKAPLAITCLKYNGPTNPIFRWDILDELNWSLIGSNPGAICTSGQRLCAICYDNQTMLASDAMLIVADYYRTNGVFPTHGTTIMDPLTFNQVTVYLKPF